MEFSYERMKGVIIIDSIKNKDFLIDFILSMYKELSEPSE